MIKAEVTKGSLLKTYPRIMQSNFTSLVVLFNSETSGTVLVGDKDFTAGEFRNNLAILAFRDLSGVLTLQNED